MSDSVSVVGVDALVAGVETAVDALLTLDLDRCADDDLLPLWQRLETVRRKFAAAEHPVIAQVERRNLAHTHGARSTAALARDLLCIVPGEAKARVSAAAAAGPRVGLTGEPLGPVFPHVAAAQQHGEISERHAALVVKTIDALPGEVAATEGDATEAFLVDQAKVFDPRVLEKVTTRLLETVSPDGDEPHRRHRDRTRGLDFSIRPDGSCHLSGELTAEATELARTVFEPLAKPKPTDTNVVGGAGDSRTATQRRHDAFVEVLKFALRAGEVPSAGGVTTTLILTGTVEDWATRTGHVLTGHGTLVPVREAAKWTDGEARVIAAVAGKLKKIEAYSTSHRFFTEGQRLAMIARDIGCTFPSCDTPAQWCESHHFQEASQGGPTTTSNGGLLCRFHHHHHQQMGWHGVMLDGIPHWTPPPWIDPQQTPRRNHVHHPELHDTR